jgi:hypothetical protein
MVGIRSLERAAIVAHRNGESWATFWANHGDEVRRAQPHDRAAFNRLANRLLALVCSGDDAGTRGIASPWELDDAQTVEMELAQ